MYQKQLLEQNMLFSFMGNKIQRAPTMHYVIQLFEKNIQSNGVF